MYSFILQVHLGWLPCCRVGRKKVVSFAGGQHGRGIEPALTLNVMDGEEGDGEKSGKQKVESQGESQEEMLGIGNIKRRVEG